VALLVQTCGGQTTYERTRERSTPAIGLKGPCTPPATAPTPDHGPRHTTTPKTHEQDSRTQPPKATNTALNDPPEPLRGSTSTIPAVVAAMSAAKVFVTDRAEWRRSTQEVFRVL